MTAVCIIKHGNLSIYTCISSSVQSNSVVRNEDNIPSAGCVVWISSNRIFASGTLNIYLIAYQVIKIKFEIISNQKLFLIVTKKTI